MTNRALHPLVVLLVILLGAGLACSATKTQAVPEYDPFTGSASEEALASTPAASEVTEAYARALLSARVRDTCPPGTGQGLLDRLLDSSEASWLGDRWQFQMTRQLPLGHLVSSQRMVEESVDVWGNGVMNGSFLAYLADVCP